MVQRKVVAVYLLLLDIPAHISCSVHLFAPTTFQPLFSFPQIRALTLISFISSPLPAEEIEIAMPFFFY